MTFRVVLKRLLIVERSVREEVLMLGFGCANELDEGNRRVGCARYDPDPSDSFETP